MERHIKKTVLDLAAYHFTLEHASVLNNVLERNLPLTTISLANVKLDTSMSKLVSDTIRQNGRIQELDLSYCDIDWHDCISSIVPLLDRAGGNWETGKGTRSIALKRINLRGNKLGDRGVTAIAKALEKNEVLEFLNISRCDWGEQSAVALGRMLEENDDLRHLSCEWNLVSADRGAQAIAHGMRFNHRLEMVDLSECGLHAAGCAYIASAIIDNESIRELDLSNNMMTASTCMVLRASLRENKHLERLYLRGNPLGHEGAEHIMRALQENDTLNFVDMSRSSFMREPPDSLFDIANPSGNYCLHLDNPVDREVAVQLAKLWEQQGPTTWQNARYNDKAFTLNPGREWPKRMPERGKLELTFVATSTPPQTASALEDDQFTEMWSNIVNNPGVQEDWCFDYLRVLCDTMYFTCKQMAVMIQRFAWFTERVEAMINLFARCVDPNNIAIIEAHMEVEEWEAVLKQLGLLVRFHPINPTGSYSLNLARALDYNIAYRLREEYLLQDDEGFCSEGHECIRNLVYEQKPLPQFQYRVSREDLQNWRLPRTGWLAFDFVHYRSPPLLSTCVAMSTLDYIVQQMQDVESLDITKLCKDIYDPAITSKSKVLKSMRKRTFYTWGFEKPDGPLADPSNNWEEEKRREMAPKVPDEEALIKDMIRRMLAKRLGQHIGGNMKTNEVPEIQGKLDRRKISAGEYVARAGMEAGEAYYISKGVIELRSYIPGSTQEKVLCEVQAGEFCGEIAIVSGKERRVISIKAKSSVILLVLKQVQLTQVFMDKPKLKRILNDASEAKDRTLVNLLMPVEDTSADRFKLTPAEVTHKRLTALRAICTMHFLHAKQVRHLLAPETRLFDTPQERVEVCIVVFTRIVDRRNYYSILLELSAVEQVMVGHRLGWLNIFDCFPTSKRPKMQYRLRLWIPDELECCRLLVRMASRAKGANNISNLKINGAAACCNEGPSMWAYIRDTVIGEPQRKIQPKEESTNLVQFNFEMKEEQVQLNAAVVLQSHIRGRPARRQLLQYKWAAFKLQVCFRGKLARRQILGFSRQKAKTIRDELVTELLWPAGTAPPIELVEIEENKMTNAAFAVHYARTVKALTQVAKMQNEQLQVLSSHNAKTKYKKRMTVSE
ncbi:hypothetical protein CYMTET_2952 [Cymbomonas tetramitiformis]|uniref:Cyclic nucleotide-binding domain-containing protein n=1 Tax=Cymbomonas tetramitiformis TaxID=36881 RepID=A0AAE0H4P3_9CHLO|nr:hypothetical protein CYMTET_2952 [Cymbomonas tetramitiformis]